MNTTIDPVDLPAARLDTRSRWSKARVLAFYVAVLAFLGTAATMLSEQLAIAYTGWFTDFGVHQVHDQLIFAFLWVALVVPVALLLVRPRARPNTVLAPLVFTLPFAALAVLAGSPLTMLGVLFGGLGLLVLVLHPAGLSVLRLDRVERVSRWLTGLFVLGALPLSVYAGAELAKQLGPADDHTLFVHYGVMAVAAGFVVLMGALAVVRERDWRFAAWSAGLTAAYLGALSLATPDVASSLGTVGGALAVVWAVAFVLGVEYVRHRAHEPDPSLTPD